MKKIKKVLAVALVGVLAFSVTGCKMIGRTPESIKNTVLAKVGDEKITKGDVDEIAEPYLKQFEASYGADFESNAKVKDQVKELRKQALDLLVEEKIMAKKATELKVVPSDEEIKSEVNKFIDGMKQKYGGDEGFNNALKSSGMTLEKYTENVTKSVKNQLTNEKVKADIFKDIKITDEDVKKYYDEHKDQYGEANVSHILIKSEGRTDEEAKAKANEVREKLVNGGDFAALAKEYSEDPGSKDKGGDYGVIPYNSTKYVKEFVDGFKSLGEGEISQPVKSQYGYHIIKATNVKKKTFDEVKDEIKATLEKEKKDNIYTETLKKWKEELDVKLYEDRI